MTLSTPCRAPALTVRVPTFTHDELRALWEAITQFAENHDEREDVPPGAERALEKLDAYFAGEVLP